MRFFAQAVTLSGLMAVTAHAAVIPAAGLDWTSVSNAVNAASSSVVDTVQLPIGTNTWVNQGLTIGKSVNIRGYGTNQTRINGTNVTTMFNWNGNNTLPFIPLSDLTIGCGVASSGQAVSIGKNPGTVSTYAAYYHINRVNLDLYSGRGWSLGSGGAKGIVSQGVYRALGSTAQNFFITWGNEYLSWAEAAPMGTTNGVYYEDISCYGGPFALPTNGHFDGYRGASSWIRHCYFYGSAPTGDHGYDSDVAGTRYLEITDCVFTNQSRFNVAADTRSGVMQVIRTQVYDVPGDIDGDTFDDGMATNGVFYLTHYRAHWGQYQSGLSYQGLDKTNRYTGTAVGGAAGNLVATNVPFGIQYGFNVASSAPWPGRSITITGGTGAGQTRFVGTAPITTTAIPANPQIQPGIITFNVTTNWDTIPDATSTFELNYVHGNSEQIGNQPAYTFTTNTPSGNRSVKIGATLNDTLDNLAACINGGAGAGTLYSFSGAVSQQINWDFSATRNGSTLILHNKQDGTGIDGYPACQQPGTMTMFQGTSTGVVMFPCLTYQCTLNGTNIGFRTRFSAVSPEGITYPWYNTNSVLEYRDFYPTNALPIAQLSYPLAVRSSLKPVDVVFTIGAVGATPTITVTEDLFASSTTLTSGTRTYPDGGTVSLSAPGTSGGNPFTKWTRDGSDYSVSATLSSVPVDQARSFVAVYGAAATVSWTVNSTACAATITTTADAATGDTVVSGCETRTYTQNDTITLIAPATCTHPTTGATLTFTEWTRDGVTYSASTTITPTADTTRDFTANYVQLGGTVSAKPGKAGRSRVGR